MDQLAQIDAFFAGDLKRWALFDALMHALLREYPQTQVRVMKTCIAFDDPKPYGYVSLPRRKRDEGLLLSISLKREVTHACIAMLVPVSVSRFTTHIPIKSEEEIDSQLLALIALSRR